MKKFLSIKKPMGILCQLVILAVPTIIYQPMCAVLWGEPECPDCLKE